MHMPVRQKDPEFSLSVFLCFHTHLPVLKKKKFDYQTITNIQQIINYLNSNELQNMHLLSSYLFVYNNILYIGDLRILLLAPQIIFEGPVLSR